MIDRCEVKLIHNLFTTDSTFSLNSTSRFSMEMAVLASILYTRLKTARHNSSIFGV